MAEETDNALDTQDGSGIKIGSNSLRRLDALLRAGGLRPSGPWAPRWSEEFSGGAFAFSEVVETKI